MNGDAKYNQLVTHKPETSFNSNAPYGFEPIKDEDELTKLDEVAQIAWNTIFLED